MGCDRGGYHCSGGLDLAQDGFWSRPGVEVREIGKDPSRVCVCVCVCVSVPSFTLPNLAKEYPGGLAWGTRGQVTSGFQVEEEVSDFFPRHQGWSSGYISPWFIWKA